MSDKPLISAQEAADLLQVHINTVWKLIKDGTLNAGKIGSSWVLVRDEVIAYARQQIMQQTAERLRKAQAIKPREHSRRRAASLPTIPA